MTLSANSLLKLDSCHPDLQKLFKAVAETSPIEVICGHRDKAEQDAAVASGNSREVWPHSRHNDFPALAVDVVPLPLNWSDTAAFHRLSTVVRNAARDLGLTVVWGGDWRMQDLPHWQIANPCP